MTQGRKPPPEPDDTSTLFEPSKESSGLIAERTPPHSTPILPQPSPQRTDSSTPVASGLGQTTAPEPGTADEFTSEELSSTAGLASGLDGNTSIMPGQVLFDRYTVERQLGEGGMGTVYLVRHRELDSERALKLIMSGIARDHQARLRFRREARILDRLNHPNAVRVYDARVLRDVAFIEMEYVRGKSLNQLLVEGQPMPLDWVTDLLDQLCSVLQAANDEGIIHRDLKPPNIMLVDGRQPGTKTLKLLDFGIAKIREGTDDVRTLTGSFMGTPLYSSPEQISGERVDARSDIYSVGLVLYELLTGYRPFEGSVTAIIYKHTSVPPPPFREKNPDATVAREIEQVVLKCLAKDPDQRPQSPRELVELFHTAVDASRADVTAGALAAKKAWSHSRTFETQAAPGPSAADRVRRAALIVTALLLVLVVIALLLRTPRPGPPGDVTESTTPRKTEPRGVVSQPRPKRSTDASAIPRQVQLWKDQGYAVDPAEKPVPGAWPAALLREVDKVRFDRDPSGIYLPRGYEPSSERAEDGYPRTLTRKDGTTFIRIMGGTFWMGTLRALDAPSEEGEAGRLVRLSGFYMQKTEATNGEIELFVKGLGPGVCADWEKKYETQKLPTQLGPEVARALPASNISWRVASDYARSHGGRLPTEAQWEYAGRSQGQPNLHVWGSREAPAQPGNINSFEAPKKVGSYAEDVTAQGILDLTGNVREWCRDVWSGDRWKGADTGGKSKPLDDPQFPPTSRAASDDAPMVVRGGSFMGAIEQGTTTARDEPRAGGNVTYEIGFRIVLECPEGPPDPQ
jgi:serine/threonine-protein kinase